ncbi:MAG: hypothetical protein AB7V16_07320 [Vulcanibacillus sp.]
MSDIIAPSSFYYQSDFIHKDTFYNSVYSLDIAIEQYFAKMLYYSDTSRIVYASNDYCFRRRAEMNEDGLLNFPFMNYYLKSITPDVSRQWWKNSNNVQTLLNLEEYKQKIGFGIKIVPVHLMYEATIWYSQDLDLQYAYSKILMSDTNETILYPTLQTESDYELKNIAIMDYNLDFKPEYTENDWLEQNNITSASLDFEFDTFAIYPDTEILVTPQPSNRGVFIANEVIFNFLSTKGKLLKNSELLNTQPQELLISYFNAEL